MEPLCRLPSSPNNEAIKSSIQFRLASSFDSNKSFESVKRDMTLKSQRKYCMKEAESRAKSKKALSKT